MTHLLTHGRTTLVVKSLSRLKKKIKSHRQKRLMVTGLGLNEDLKITNITMETKINKVNCVTCDSSFSRIHESFSRIHKWKCHKKIKHKFVILSIAAQVNIFKKGPRQQLSFVAKEIF